MYNGVGSAAGTHRTVAGVTVADGAAVDTDQTAAISRTTADSRNHADTVDVAAADIASVITHQSADIIACGGDRAAAWHNFR